MNIDDMVDILAIDLLGVVPDDEHIVISTNRGEPAIADDKSLAGQAYRNVVKRILGENVPFMSLDTEEGFMAKLARAFGFRKR